MHMHSTSNFILVMCWCAEIQTNLTMEDIDGYERGRNILRQQLSKKSWGIHKIQDNDNMTKFYTGLPSFTIFLWLFK